MTPKGLQDRGWRASLSVVARVNNNILFRRNDIQQQQQQQQQSFYPNAQCSHQCQGFHATPANTPTLWGGSSSSTKYPNDSSRPPTPSFPPYDVRTLHFVACGRPWLLHWRGVHTHRSWSLFWGAHVPRMVFFARDSGPWQARERHRRSSRCARKSPAKPRWTGMLKNHWFLKDSARARGWIFRFFG